MIPDSHSLQAPSLTAISRQLTFITISLAISSSFLSFTGYLSRSFDTHLLSSSAPSHFDIKMTSATVRTSDQLCFNVSVVAYDHGLIDRVAGQRLGFGAIKRNTNIAGLDAGSFTIPDIEATPEELALDEVPTAAFPSGAVPEGWKGRVQKRRSTPSGDTRS